MPPLACIVWPAGTPYTGTYRDKDGTWIDSHHAHSKYRVQTGVLAGFRAAGTVRYLKVRREGIRGWAYLNHEAELARAAAAYHRPRAERCREAQRQQAPSGEWFLSPGAFSKFVCVSATTREYWRKNGVPILDGTPLDLHDFPDGSGRLTPYYSERQARAIVKARAAASEGLLPVRVAAGRCGVDVRLVRRLACEGTIDAELGPAHAGGQTVWRYAVSVDDLRREVRQRRADKTRPQTITDPIPVAEAAEVCGVHPTTVNKWIDAGKVGHEDLGHLDQGGRRFVVSRAEVLAFAARQRRTRAAGGEEDWLLPRQVYLQYPQLNWDILRYYLRRPAPPLGRTVRRRKIDRPAGLKCRHKVVRQYWAEDVRRLAEWVTQRGAAGAVTPSSPAADAMPSADHETASTRRPHAGRGELLAQANADDPYLNALGEIRGGVRDLREQLGRTPELTADEVCRRVDNLAAGQAPDQPAPPSPRGLAERLVMDLTTGTATLDGESFHGVGIDGLRALDALRTAQLQGKTPVSKEQLRTLLRNCHHDTTLTRWLDRLPEPLRDLVKGVPGSGLRLVLPPA